MDRRGRRTIASVFNHVLLVGATWLGACLVSTADADGVGPTELLASACTGCHGADVGGALRVPGLLTLDAGEIRDTMTSFVGAEEPQTVMRRIASAYTDEEIRLIAEYLGELD